MNRKTKPGVKPLMQRESTLIFFRDINHGSSATADGSFGATSGTGWARIQPQKKAKAAKVLDRLSSLMER